MKSSPISTVISMAEEKKKHHHHHHHHKEEKKPVEAVVYSVTASGVDAKGQRYKTTETVGHVSTQTRKAHHSKEHLSELRTVAAGARALCDKYKAKKVPENKPRYKTLQEKTATVVKVGADGYTFYEYHQKKETKHEQEKAEGKHHHRH